MMYHPTIDDGGDDARLRSPLRPERLRPATLGLIIFGHVGLLALVMSAKSGTVHHNPFTPTVVTLVPEPRPPISPPPPQPQPDPGRATLKSTRSTRSSRRCRRPARSSIGFQPLPQPGPVIGSGPAPTPIPLDPPIVRTGPRFSTAEDAIRPPYPDSMRQSGSEASLRLRLSIDERGRVVAVDPVGRADPTFLSAARRHILRVWRYKPAMEGARAVPSTTTITLNFELGNG